MLNTLSQPTRNGGSSHVPPPFIIITITLFALSGLITGFAIGAITRLPKSTANNFDSISITTTSTTPTPLSVSQPTTQTPTRLGYPALTVQQQTSTTPPIVYNAVLQAKAKADNPNIEQPITDDGITCRIWLAQNDPKKPDAISEQLLKNSTLLQHTDQFHQLFPGEIQNALVLDPSTPTLTQACIKGKGVWKFTLSSSLNPGNYNLVGLTDWNGMYYNWCWKSIVAPDKQ